jgi:polysaccharide biosynthesis protein PslG
MRLGVVCTILLFAITIVSAGCGGAPAATPTATLAKPAAPTYTPRPVLASPTAGSVASHTPIGVANVTPTSGPTPTQAPGGVTPAATAVGTATAGRVLRMQSPEYGTQVFLWWQPATTDRDLQLVKDGGFTWVKQNFSWIDIEGAAKGALDWSESDRVVGAIKDYGLDIVARVDKEPEWARKGASKGPVASYADYGEFLFQMATRYKGKIRAYEIWNEPNLGREWGGQADAVEYVKMLKIAYERIKQADPNAAVVTAGLSPTTAWGENVPDEDFLKRIYVSGAKPYFDFLGVHAAGYKAPPETDPAAVANGSLKQYCAWEKECARIYVFRHVEDLRKIMVDNGDSGKQVMVLEFGWDSDNRTDSLYKWHYVTEETKADYIVRAFQYAKKNWSPWMGAMTVIYIAKPDWTDKNEEYWWSITYPDGRVRPAYTVFKDWRAKGSP